MGQISVSAVGHFYISANNINPLSGSGRTDRSLAEGQISPVHGVLPAGVPLDDVVDPLLGGELDFRIPGIMGRIATHKEWVSPSVPTPCAGLGQGKG